MINYLNTKNNQVSLTKQAMNFGIVLGSFWAVKYLVFIGVSVWVHFIYLYYLMNVGTFLLIYIFYLKFRDVEPERPRSKFDCFKFVIALCFFASFFEAAMIYAHLQFIDPNYYATKIQPALLGVIDTLPYPPDAKASAIELSGNKLLYVISSFTSNLFLGTILGGILTLIVGNKKK